MACFIVPAVEAIAVTVASKAVKSQEKKVASLENNGENVSVENAVKIPFSDKLKWLTNLLWGGSALLAFEHIWHGEVVPYFPFLTAALDPEDTLVMLQEMATAGVSMALLVTAVWGGMLAVSHIIEKRAARNMSVPEEGESA